MIDGQGSVSGRTAAMDQALTLKPDGIVVGGFDTNEQQVAFDAAAKSGAVVVGWHSGTKPGPEPEAGIFANVTTSPQDVSNTAAYRGDRRFRRQGRRHHLHRHAVRNRGLQGAGDGGRDQEMRRLHGAGVRRLADRRKLAAHAPAHDDAAAEVRRQVDAIRLRSTISISTSWDPRLRRPARRATERRRRSRRATVRNPHSSASAPSSIRPAPCRSRSTSRAGSWSTN